MDTYNARYTLTADNFQLWLSGIFKCKICMYCKVYSRPGFQYMFPPIFVEKPKMLWVSSGCEQVLYACCEKKKFGRAGTWTRDIPVMSENAAIRLSRILENIWKKSATWTSLIFFSFWTCHFFFSPPFSKYFRFFSDKILYIFKWNMVFPHVKDKEIWNNRWYFLDLRAMFPQKMAVFPKNFVC